MFVVLSWRLDNHTRYVAREIYLARLEVIRSVTFLGILVVFLSFRANRIRMRRVAIKRYPIALLGTAG